MPLFDLPLEQLEKYRSSVVEPVDFDEFWDQTLAEAQSFDLAATFEPVNNRLAVIETFDVTFAGFGGAPIKGWLHLPAHREPGKKLPAVVEYLGYSGGRSLPNQGNRWAQAGYAHFVMDTRGQGFGGSFGETPDPHPSAGGVAYAGLMTRGINSREDYYYRRLFVDGFRAVQAVQRHPAVDPHRIVLNGISQGGGISLAVAGLVAGRLDGVIGVLPDVPFLQDFPRAIDTAAKGPYPDIFAFLSRHREKYEGILKVLNYFDGVHFAARAQTPVLYSVALADDVCPPSTVFASYNAYGEKSGDVRKAIEVYRFNNHEGGQEHHWVKQLDFLQSL
ncbi:acetylxylan esterase [Pseudarthrobacter sp. J1738]|uniref:acetylxylan esterase n=1 Tax=Pseudarthrobacter sp. J1738 TaxID=3420446 RepID=UPI003D2A5DDE